MTVDRGGSAISRAVNIVSRRAGVSAICIIAAVMVSGVCRSLGPDGVGAAAAASAPTHGLTGVGNWVWYYQTIAPSDALKFNGATAVVTTTQPDTATALATIHSTGALAFSYMNAYWLPLGRIYDGIDLARHPGWEFSGERGNPLPPGRVTGPPGQQELWMYPDLNERGMHAAFVPYLQGLKASGYDGVFFDRGVVALRRGRMPDRVSGCTAHPVRLGSASPIVCTHRSGRARDRVAGRSQLRQRATAAQRCQLDRAGDAGGRSRPIVGTRVHHGVRAAAGRVQPPDALRGGGQDDQPERPRGRVPVVGRGRALADRRRHQHGR